MQHALYLLLGLSVLIGSVLGAWLFETVHHLAAMRPSQGMFRTERRRSSTIEP